MAASDSVKNIADSCVTDDRGATMPETVNVAGDRADATPIRSPTTTPALAARPESRTTSPDDPGARPETIS